MNRLNHRLGLVLLYACLFSLFGCSTDENPITPDKMEEIRKQEGDERANFNPSATTPPPPSTEGR